MRDRLPADGLPPEAREHPTPPPESFVHYLFDAADDPDLPAVTSGGVTLSTAELRSAAERIAVALQDAGTRPGSVVAVELPSSTEMVATFFAVWSCQAAIAPLSPRLGRGDRTRMLAALRPDVYLSRGQEDDRAGVPSDSGIVELHEQQASVVATTGSVRQPRDNIAVILHTSGTSGPPKAVPLTHAQIRAAIDALLSSLGARASRGDVPTQRGNANLLCFPLHHLAGIYNLVLALRNKRELLLMEKFTVKEFVELVSSYRIPSVILNPTMIHMVLNADVQPEALASLRFVRSGSAPLPRSLAQDFYERFGIPVLNAYGQTETAGEVIGWSAADIRAFATSKVGSVGRPHIGVDVKFIDEHGEVVGLSETGELCVRSPSVVGGYLDGSSQQKFADGYLGTGDLGYMDEDGFVWLVGRRSDVIICGGFKIMPEEVEDVIRTHGDVLDVMVAGLPDERLGEVAHAFVVPRPGWDDESAAQLVGLVREALASYKAPRAIHVVDGLPRNSSDKLVRSQASSLISAAAPDN